MIPYASLVRVLGPYVVGVAVLGGAYIAGRHHGGSGCEERHRAALATHLQRAIEQSNDIARQDWEVASAAQAAERVIEVRYRQARQEVEDNVEVVKNVDCPVLNSVASSLLDRAVSGALYRAAAGAGKPAGKMPGPAGPGVPPEVAAPVPGQPGPGVPHGAMPGSTIDPRGGVVLPLPGAPYGPI